MNLTLTPSGFGRPDIAAFRVEYAIEVDVVAGGLLLAMPSRITSVETMAPRDVVAEDAAGPVPLVMQEIAGDADADHRQWLTERAVTGTLRVRYTIPVRPVDENTRSAPLYDLRAEGAGLNGTGMTFLALPSFEGAVDLTIQWDLSDAPPGTRAVTSWGEGTVSTTATHHDLAYAHFSVGPLRSHPAEGDPSLDTFGFYWTSEPTFDPVRIGEYAQGVYTTMAEFFEDPDPGFRVFARKHPYRGGGGCSLTRSFIFGYSEALPTSDTERAALIAHETVHTWVTLDGDQPALSWYAEGLADYYATVLPHRAGMIDDGAFLERMNAHVELYYANPLQRLTFDRATELFWEDMRAQRVPYGRGMAYFLDLAGRLRDVGADLDSLVLEVLRRQRSGQTVGAAEWNGLVGRHLGDSLASRLHADLLSGDLLRPHSRALGDGFVQQDRDVPVIDIGFATGSLAGDRIVRDLDPTSDAAAAGLRDGDQIVDGLSFAELESTPDRIMRLRVSRPSDWIEYRAVRGSVAGVAWVTG
jgi:predicted metalloprotease with PDZ domain